MKTFINKINLEYTVFKIKRQYKKLSILDKYLAVELMEDVREQQRDVKILEKVLHDNYERSDHVELCCKKIYLFNSVRKLKELLPATSKYI